MGFKMNLGLWNSIFAVPTRLVDENLKLADEASLKVILFLLRHSDKYFSEDELMKSTGIKSKSKIKEALEFWQDRQLISVVDDEISPQKSKNSDYIKKIEKQVDDAEIVVNSQVKSAVKKVELSRPPRYSPQEIAMKIKESDRSNQVFSLAERLYSRPLKHSEHQILMEIIEYAELPVDVTMMLLKFCHSIGKTSFHYIHKTAISWAEEDINTVELADLRIKEICSQSDIFATLRREMEFNSTFSKKQKELILKWTNEMNFSVEMIMVAYQITLDNTGKLAFQYMNKILENWYTKGFTTPEQVESERQAMVQEKKQSTDSSFDLDDIEAKSLEKYRSINNE